MLQDRVHRDFGAAAAAAAAAAVGDKIAVDAILQHPGIAARLVRRLHTHRAATSTRPATKAGKRVQALGGAKNHMIVLPDADIDMAADAAV